MIVVVLTAAVVAAVSAVGAGAGGVAAVAVVLVNAAAAASAVAWFKALKRGAPSKPAVTMLVPISDVKSLTSDSTVGDE